ncbi:MAG: ABC transporter ATP-binding protein [Rhodocyclaceae bacterium]|nr:ABC transporter ATP-binding protein [Rhodocyclaceae bacterium]
MNAFTLTDLNFRWPRQLTPCLIIPSFIVAAGERVFLHGPSGSGKSTLLALLGGIAQPQTGKVEVLGQDLNDLSGHSRDRFRADHIGFIFQQFNLLPWLSALDNVLLPCVFSMRRKRYIGNAHKEATRLLAHLDLTADLWRKPAAELSVGQQQRVAAARALMGKPEIIIADEPTSALDAKRQQIFIDLLLTESAAVGATLLFVSHDERLAAHFDRRIALDEINQVSSECNE